MNLLSHEAVRLASLAAILLCFGSQPSAEIDDANISRECTPCSFQIAPGIVYAFNLHLKSIDSRETVDRIVVTDAGTQGAVQELTVDTTDFTRRAGGFALFAMDVNFDGYKDIALIASPGTVNNVAMYWLFNAQTRRFDALGKYPVFTVDQTHHRLSTYERGGHGGMIYEAKTYEFIRGKLTLIRAETQDWVAERHGYRKVVKELRNNALRVTKDEFLRPN